MANPKRSVELLNQLETLGFTDEAFALLHHSRVRGRRDTIVSHRSYCEKHSLFQRDGDNERTQRRLEFVLRRYLHGGGSDCRSDIFVELANRAFGEIPPGKIVGKRATAELISHEHRSRRQTSRSIEAPRAHFETRCSFDRQTNSVTDTELEGLWREYARRFSQEHIKNELKRSWPNDLNIVQDRIEFSYPPTFQPGYVGPLFSTSRRRILFLAYNPGVGQNNREGDKELSERLKTFATGKLSFADFNRFLAGHLMNWPSLYSDNGVFREAGEGISLLPRLNRPSIRCVALLNFFPFKTIGNGNPRGGALKAAMWQYFVKPTIDLLQPNLIVRYPNSDRYKDELLQVRATPEIVRVWHPTRYNVNAQRKKLIDSWSPLARQLSGVTDPRIPDHAQSTAPIDRN